MLSIIFHSEGLTDWWNPNQTSLPPPKGLEHPSDAVKNDRPTGVYLTETKHISQEVTRNLFPIFSDTPIQMYFITTKIHPEMPTDLKSIGHSHTLLKS